MTDHSTPYLDTDCDICLVEKHERSDAGQGLGEGLGEGGPVELAVGRVGVWKLNLKLPGLFGSWIINRLNFAMVFLKVLLVCKYIEKLEAVCGTYMIQSGGYLPFQVMHKHSAQRSNSLP